MSAWLANICHGHASRAPARLRVALLLAGSLLAAGALAGPVWTNAPVATNQGSLLDSVLDPVKRAQKPARFDSFQQRLDYIHQNLYTDYNTRVERTDSYFGRVLTEHEQPAPSRFRLGLFFEADRGATNDFAFKPSFNAKIKLPNVEKRWDVFLNTLKPGELPGADPTEVNNALRIGVGTLTHIPHVSVNAGLRVTWPPEASLELSWRPRWTWEEWTIMPMQQVFYETDDGFGEQTQLALFRWFGKYQRWTAGSMTAGTWSQSTDGLEWEQTIKGGYIRELLEEKERGQAIDRSDLAQGTGLRYSLFGSDKDFTEHRFMLSHRRPLYKKWIYIELNPGLKWRADHDWKTDPFILLGLDFIFWGTPEK